MSLITLADAKASLGITVSTYDTILQSYCDAALPVIEDIVGPLTSASKTFTTNGGVPLIVLPTPATTVTSVTVNGTATTGYTADLVNGIIYGGTSVSPQSFSSGNMNVVVSYTVGSGSDPAANIKLAARELVRFWWQVGQQGNRPGFGDAPVADMSTPSGFAVPRRVIELCGPNLRAPGVG